MTDVQQRLRDDLRLRNYSPHRLPGRIGEILGASTGALAIEVDVSLCGRGPPRRSSGICHTSLTYTNL